MSTDISTAEIMMEFSNKEDVLKEMGVSINALLNTLLRQHKIETHSISFRVKERHSLEKKIKNKNKYRSLNEITDILGFRIITFYSEDIDKIEKVIGEQFSIDPVNSIDKRKSMEPDRFGYMSLHYIVYLNDSRSKLPEYIGLTGLKFEIQIRTILQHSWAEIEHELGYKSKNSMPDEIRRLFSILSGTLELIDGEFTNIKNKIADYSQTVRDDVIQNKTNDILINEVSLIALIDSDSNLNDLYNIYLEKALKKNLSHSVRRTEGVELESVLEGVGIIKSLGFKTISDLQSVIAESIKDNTDEDIIELQLLANKSFVFIKYTFFMFTVYYSYYKKNDSLGPAVIFQPNLGDLESAIGRQIKK